MPDKVRIGYMRLIDAAPIIFANELGYFTDAGVQVELVREVSWANLRDRLIIGDINVAQILSPLAIATTVGIGSVREALVAGLSLGHNGNAICLSLPLFEAMEHDLPGQWIDHPLASAQVMARLIQRRRQRALAPYTFATVFPYSMHTLLIAMWLRAAGCDISRDVRLITLPPEQMVTALERREIDGFCAGAPWSSASVNQGLGVLAVAGCDIWNSAPGKVLATTATWQKANETRYAAVCTAVLRACRWLETEALPADVAQILSQPHYINRQPADLIPALSGRLVCASWTNHVARPDALVFSRHHANYPWRSDARLLAEALVGLLTNPQITAADAAHQAEHIFRPDIYRACAAELGIETPNADDRPWNDHDKPFEHAGVVIGPNRWLTAPYAP
ncbi:MAG: ABC transporter substrate-binding protein [Gammaproteobacteria bacterium]|nr:ABC transporter substrate-binding protein [Gammaproteobacteria bacterium]